MEEKKILNDILGLSGPFPTDRLLIGLAEATEKLLKDFDYDGHGYEVLEQMVAAARKRAEILKTYKGR